LSFYLSPNRVEAAAEMAAILTNF